MDLTTRLAQLATQRDLLDVMVAQQYTPYANRAWQSGLDPAMLLQMYVLDPDPVQHTAKFLRLWRPPYGAHVLDCGCGTGSFAALLQAQRPDLQWTLLGHNTDQLHYAARVAPCCQGDMHALPFIPGTFDAVLCAYSLGYAYAPTVFGEVAQALKPGGQVVLLDMVAKDGDRADRVLVSLGYKCYNATQLLAYAAAHGWQVQECGTPRAILHPQVQGLADDTVACVAEETHPMYGIWTQQEVAHDVP